MRHFEVWNYIWVYRRPPWGPWVEDYICWFSRVWRVWSGTSVSIIPFPISSNFLGAWHCLCGTSARRETHVRIPGVITNWFDVLLLDLFISRPTPLTLIRFHWLTSWVSQLFCSPAAIEQLVSKDCLVFFPGPNKIWYLRIHPNWVLCE